MTLALLPSTDVTDTTGYARQATTRLAEAKERSLLLHGTKNIDQSEKQHLISRNPSIIFLFPPPPPKYCLLCREFQFVCTCSLLSDEVILTAILLDSQSPINASKAAGVTPQTLAAPPHFHPPTTTAVSQPLGYPPAKPGAAIPAPTGTAQRSVPVGPTPTTKTYGDDAAPPQPGAFPVPLTSSTKLQHANPQQVPGTQQSYPYQPNRPSSAATNMVTALPAAEFGARQNDELPLEHPPGYQQVGQVHRDMSPIFAILQALKIFLPSYGSPGSTFHWCFSAPEKLLSLSN
jgi:hypothetical protein